MPPRHPACLPPDELLAQVETEVRRGSGPGGQHRNKVETGVRLKHPSTGIVAQAGERRTRPDNLRVALFRLRLALAVQHRQPPDEHPSERWRRRTAGPTLAVASDHDDVPALLAEALDVLVACDDDLPAAAARLHVSPSRLVKVLKLAPEALREVNRRAEARGLPTWR